MSKSWQLKINKSIAPEVRKAANRGLAIAAEHVLGESRKLVPIEEATLERSGTVTTDPDNLQAAISYDTPYAIRQHEDMGLRHDAGRESKYLETPLNAERDAVKEIIARTIKGEF